LCTLQGFGQVYLAQRIGRSALVPEIVCIKVGRHLDGWLREAYRITLLNDAQFWRLVAVGSGLR
jgi:hypothetical protein